MVWRLLITATVMFSKKIIQFVRNCVRMNSGVIREFQYTGSDGWLVEILREAKSWIITSSSRRGLLRNTLVWSVKLWCPLCLAALCWFLMLQARVTWSGPLSRPLLRSKWRLMTVHKLGRRTEKLHPALNGTVALIRRVKSFEALSPSQFGTLLPPFFQGIQRRWVVEVSQIFWLYCCLPRCTPPAFSFKTNSLWFFKVISMEYWLMKPISSVKIQFNLCATESSLMSPQAFEIQVKMFSMLLAANYSLAHVFFAATKIVISRAQLTSRAGGRNCWYVFVLEENRPTPISFVFGGLCGKRSSQASANVLIKTAKSLKLWNFFSISHVESSDWLCLNNDVADLYIAIQLPH